MERGGISSDSNDDSIRSTAMMTTDQRTAILELSAKGVARREISRLLGVSRPTVRKVIREQVRESRTPARREKAAPHRQEILELYRTCQGNLMRVHEELQQAGIAISYPALTGFCRRNGIGTSPPTPAGRYHFEPGQEMQHDTSPHLIDLGGRKRRVQTAAAVLAHSRMLFFQCYPTFQRFDCKVFLTEALRYLQGAPQTVMIDNTHVVILRGTGRDMLPVPEMAAFAERYGFEFRAHAIGHADRKARVERPFHFIENNFFVGRAFTDWTDLNTRARAWCDKVNRTWKRHLRAVPFELWQSERTALRTLPIWCPDPYRLHQRIVDVEGYVSVGGNRYSVPFEWIGRRTEVRESAARLAIVLGHETITHDRVVDALDKRITLPAHRPPRGKRPTSVSRERERIADEAPELLPFLDQLEKRGKKSPTLAGRQLLRLIRDYPRPPLVAAIDEALRFGLFDLARIERMVLRRIGTDYFRIGSEPDHE